MLLMYFIYFEYIFAHNGWYRYTGDVTIMQRDMNRVGGQSNILMWKNVLKLILWL